MPACICRHACPTPASTLQAAAHQLHASCRQPHSSGCRACVSSVTLTQAKRSAQQRSTRPPAPAVHAHNPVQPLGHRRSRAQAPEASPSHADLAAAWETASSEAAYSQSDLGAILGSSLLGSGADWQAWPRLGEPARRSGAHGPPQAWPRSQPGPATAEHRDEPLADTVPAQPTQAQPATELWQQQAQQQPAASSWDLGQPAVLQPEAVDAGPASTQHTQRQLPAAAAGAAEPLAGHAGALQLRRASLSLSPPH